MASSLSSEFCQYLGSDCVYSDWREAALTGHATTSPELIDKAVEMLVSQNMRCQASKQDTVNCLGLTAFAMKISAEEGGVTPLSLRLAFQLETGVILELPSFSDRQQG